ncbi:MAG TPA: transketolase [Noviherbaspirillum sp.]|uniref:transketolase n=1 Tax=Noviherbaspirillum sp. TaxID=1926288 RepID=UPI002B4A6962|nr:transketolase [Noviherbaspirillum sp.]HJV85309.1 transketolase [Noviherbaspirillum sp.]
MTTTSQQLSNALRFLAIDAVQAANSGHPGMPMGMADIAEVLWRRYLRHNPANPRWIDRDRFVLSNGHGSMLLYALLHLSGYDLSIDELKKFRQMHSKTPGHPEYGITPGVETTTGPLGQGLTNAVGMALAERLLAEEFNRPDHTIIDHYTYVFLGDGCLMEGISHEACSLAGTLKLGKLICFYDDNGISIDGHVEHWFADDTPKRFQAYGWHVIPNVDGHDHEAIDKAIQEARGESGRPTLICCKTVIGKGSPNKAGTHDVHGAALGDKEIAATREALDWAYPPFEIPERIRAAWDQSARGAMNERAWAERYHAYALEYPGEAVELMRRMSGNLPENWAVHSLESQHETSRKAETVASRKASQNAIELIAPALPELLGGSADLTSSNLTNWSGSVAVRAEHRGNHINYGVREFGMSAIMNGIALHGGFIPYGGTFLTFSDYSRNALRMAALMRIRSIFVFTHDSIGLGEDGPTHQPIEHVTSLRIIPNMSVWRPCDSSETMAAWSAAIERKHGPTALILSRQNLPFQQRTPDQIIAIRRGGYVLSEAANGKPHAVLIATGSEVMLAMQAQRELEKEEIFVRVVSMPSNTEFDLQGDTYRRSVLLPGVPKVAMEAGVTDGWHKYIGENGRVLGIDTFGESAPAAQLYKHFGLTSEAFCQSVKTLLGK